jgi:transcriptional regulator with XRE-family HTH domain
MSRPSNPTTPLAQTRLRLGLTQDEMAKLLKCSRHAVQAISIGKLKMSPRMEAKLAAIEGKDVAKLLEERVSEFRKKLYEDAGIPLPPTQ